MSQSSTGTLSTVTLFSQNHSHLKKNHEILYQKMFCILQGFFFSFILTPSPLFFILLALVTQENYA